MADISQEQNQPADTYSVGTTAKKALTKGHDSAWVSLICYLIIKKFGVMFNIGAGEETAAMAFLMPAAIMVPVAIRDYLKHKSIGHAIEVATKDDEVNQ